MSDIQQVTPGKPGRIQRLRTAGFHLPDGTLCVTRPTIWGNPWIGPDAVEAYRCFCEQVVSGVLCVSALEDVLDVTRKFDKPIERWKELRSAMFEFVVKPPLYVACYCDLNQLCHGNVIARLSTLFAWRSTSRSIPSSVVSGVQS